MEQLCGFVDHIIFQNEENGYTVMVIKAENEDIPDDAHEQDELVTCVGNFFGVTSGEHLRITGEYRQHKSYGMQFSATGFETIEPADVEGILKYLSSGAIKGIGPKLAKRIVDQFGDKTFEIMEKRPERLAEVKGISNGGAMDIADQVVGRRDQRSAMMLLASYGFGPTLSLKIYNKYKSNLRLVIEENPYRIADEVDGVGFKMADAIAAKNGYAVDSEFRIACAITYILSMASGEGHTYVPEEELMERAMQLLGVGSEDIDAAMDNMVMDRKLKKKGDAIYLPYYYRAEANVAKSLLELDMTYDVDIEGIEKDIERAEKEQNAKLDEIQRKAITEAMSHGVFVLTGGPGTGKTTTINTIMRLFEMQGFEISLCAPTGRAAKRMSEATGREASTIHRMLGVQPKKDDEQRDKSKSRFNYNEDEPLPTDVIIVDEVSMVDISLMDSLVRAIAIGTRLVLVGDANQLPSVGPGNVLKDVIRSNAFSVVKLEKIFRQAGKSDIVENAHSINRGEHVSIDNRSDDFFFAKSKDAEKIISKVCAYLRPDSLAKYVDCDPYAIQVLTPTRKGNLGVERLNGILQETMNPADGRKAQCETGGRTFRVGDKVMQTKNNYDIQWRIAGKYNITIEQGEGVFNGDMGIIKGIDNFSKVVEVRFDDDREVEYTFNEMEDVDLAYAVTIHKSQGSEYPAVIIPLLQGPKMLFNRNLIYTAITRAKKCVCIVGDEDAFVRMIDNATENKRYSGLRVRIEELLQ